MSDHNITYLTDVSLLTCMVQIGLSEVILKAARDVGATAGAISHHARGVGARERLGILGIAVEAEKEVISILVSSEQRDLVYDTLYRAADGLGVERKAQGFGKARKWSLPAPMCEIGRASCRERVFITV